MLALEYHHAVFPLKVRHLAEPVPPPPPPAHATEMSGNRVYQHFGGNIADMLVILKAWY